MACLWFISIFITYICLYLYQLMTKLRFTLSSISNGQEFWSVKYTSIHKSFKSNDFAITFFGDEFSNWEIDLFGTNVDRTVESAW